jgi:streptogramin lyase
MHSTMTTPLFALLSIGFLLRGLRRQKLIDFALAGIFLALGLCFYTSFRLVLPAFGLFGLYCLIAYPFLIRRSWLGLLILSLGMALVVTPLVMYAYHQPDIFWARVQDTYLLANKTPEERLPVLIESIRKHLFMFNYVGDPNGRHNLPGEPMLDPILGALMVLGFFLALRWIWRPAALLLPLWLGISLLGGILSLDFEAPQSLRANGALPVAYIFAVVPIYGLWQEWRRLRFGRRYPRLFVWPLLALLLYVGYLNYEDYFGRRAEDFASWNAFSTPESIAATLLQEEGDEADFHIISFLHGHPTINFLARDHKNYGRIETTDQMPLRRSPDRDMVLLLNAESRAIYDEARRHYPNATFEEIGAPFGGPPVIFYARLTPEDIASIQGLIGHYYANEEWDGDAAVVRKDSTIQFDWSSEPPLPAPFSAEWTGVLNIERYGPYRLILRSPAAAELYLNEGKLLEGSGELSGDVVLARGNHALRLRAVGGEGPLELAWQAPGSAEETIPTWAFYVPPVSNNGLLGRYYPNGDWQPPEAFARIDPKLEFYFHVPMLPRPYTVEWIGKIYIAQPGLYRFGLESIDESVLYIDEQEITAARTPNQLSEGSLTLTAGLHDIRIRYGDRTGHTHINLYWSPPGRGQSHVPAEVLFPPQGSYDRIDLEAAAEIFRVQANPVAASVTGSAIAARRLIPAAEVIPVELDRPRALAVAPAQGRVYVADAKEMLILDSEGKVTRRVNRGSERFSEIADIAVSTAGQVYVLDAGRGLLSLFAADGDYVRDIPTQDLHSGRSRGLFVDDQDRIWIANTPNGQIVALDQDGNVLQVLPVIPGAETQPVDVLVTNDGSIYVTDVASNQLVRIRPELSIRDAWSIPIANSVDGPHLAQDSTGTIYMSAPEQGVVLRMDADGEDGIEYDLPRQSEFPVKAVGIGVGNDNRVWVIDSEGSAVISFAPVE